MASIRWLDDRDRRFRIGDWECRSSDPRPGAVEASDVHAISFTRRGVYRKHLGGEPVLCEPGTAAFFRPGREYRTSHPVPGGDRCTIVAAPAEWFEEMSEGRARRGAPAWQSRRLDPREALLARRLHAAATHGIGLAAEEALALLLPSVCGEEPRDPATACAGGTRARHRKAVETVRLLLAERFEDDLGLEEIARHAAYSPTRLCVVFKRHTGTSVHRHLIRLRLLAALDRLGDYESLSRLAFELGFSSHSHFTAAFRSEFGLPPSRVRRDLGPRVLAGPRGAPS